MTTRLDISIGPVQGFVARSRRTRDLWGSSYLLSFLAAHAMLGTAKAGGRIVQPVVDGDPLYCWVADNRVGDPPRIGSVPNHFVAEVEGDAAPVARAGVRAFEVAWQRVCDAVWTRFVEGACETGEGTERIWQRQTGTFWEATWTAGPPAAGASLLARRKHWRSHRAADEPGDKCTVMHDLQELSGHVRAETRTSRASQDSFWHALRWRLGSLDLRDDERLCAIALVKRLFPKVASAALGWEVDASHWPSTVYVGAVPWMRRVVETVPDQAREYATTLQRSGLDPFPMRRPPIVGLGMAAAGDFAKLDANYLHRAYVTSTQLCPLPAGGPDGVRDDLAGRLQRIYDAPTADAHPLGGPPSFYALLLADGDRLGRLVSELGGPVVSNALAAFTADVPPTVARHDGVTVYAGGDDLLAMLPVSSALRCADALSDAYGAAFGATAAADRATLSAAVVFAHVRLPLQSVLEEARRLLDDVAKDGNGRDSLAAAVVKPGGLHCQWVTSWARPATGGNARAVPQIDALIVQLGGSATEPGLSSTLVYRLREILARLCGWDRWHPGDWGRVPDGLDLRAFLHAEILHSLDVRMDDDAGRRAGELTDRVCALLGRSHAAVEGLAGAGFDALLLARFLADPEQHGSDR